MRSAPRRMPTHAGRARRARWAAWLRCRTPEDGAPPRSSARRPCSNEPVASASAIAASLPEISSNARNRSAILYGCPSFRPTTSGSTLTARLEARTVASGFSTGMSDTAVRILSVLAGPYCACGCFAARIWPVVASAITNAPAGTFGTRGERGDGVVHDHAGPGQFWTTDLAVCAAARRSRPMNVQRQAGGPRPRRRRQAGSSRRGRRRPR